MNRKLFFDIVREQPFNGRLSRTQVEGMDAILNKWEQRNLDNIRWLAYILGTTYHESARTMQPIEEIGRGQNYFYGKTGFWGRGFVQVTLEANYKKMNDHLKKTGKHPNIDLLNHPEQACQIDVALDILFDGMILGMFTGKKLANYFTDETNDWYNARWIVNSKWDRATDIMNYSRAFLYAIDMAIKSEQDTRDIEPDKITGDLNDIYREFGHIIFLLEDDECNSEDFYV